jgi:methyltransferase (TIGR00027 family)
VGFLVIEKPPGNISRTAANMALIRALETLKPARQQLFADPFARRFLPAWQHALLVPAWLPAWRREIEHIFDAQAPGARTSGAARTRLIDDWAREAVREGVTAVVIMGAGFDCRALRISELATVPVFELDRREMLDLKSRCLADVTAPHVRRVPIDFLSERPEERLASAGYSDQAKTLFIWEGVTNYLDPSAVDAVFNFVGRSPVGSRLIFTYVHADAIDGSFMAPGLAHLLNRLRRTGEAWTFGFRPSDLPAYLEQRGFRLVAEMGAAEYRALYWPRPKLPEGYEFYHVALAERQDAASRA